MGYRKNGRPRKEAWGSLYFRSRIMSTHRWRQRRRALGDRRKARKSSEVAQSRIRFCCKQWKTPMNGLIKVQFLFYPT